MKTGIKKSIYTWDAELRQYAATTAKFVSNKLRNVLLNVISELLKTYSVLVCFFLAMLNR